MTALNPLTTMTEKPDARRHSSLRWPLQHVTDYVFEVVLDGVRQVEGNLAPVCICGAITFPLYWLVWRYLFPQPYENLPLRLVGTALCLFIAAKDWWPPALRRYLPAIWLGMLLYALPFFFTFMLLQNNTSDIWIMSTLSALFLLVLLVDWISVIVLFVVGSALGWGVHVLMEPGMQSVNLYAEFVPIFLFALIAGTIFNYKAAGFREAGARARREVGALVAKEMQSPLVSIRTHAASLQKFLPMLIGGQSPDSAATEAPAPSQLRALERVPARIEEAVGQINSVVETLLVEGDEPGAQAETTSALLISQCLAEAIDGMPGKSELDRARVIFHRDNDFHIQGPPTLIAHVLAGVLEASFDSTYQHTGAELVIDLGRAGRWNYIRLQDSSVGLRPMAVAHLLRFGLVRTDRKFPNRPDLAFAKLVLGRIGGWVTRTVEFGRTTEVVLWFPQPGSP
ncbi:MAG TPA: hypothetical protein VMU42_08110 [Candidatus Sulfotelmatobacter sp.]|nr:hypothetical protein [Candidatus Sulfotelmatobacter sp.]